MKRKFLALLVILGSSLGFYLAVRGQSADDLVAMFQGPQTLPEAPIAQADTEEPALPVGSLRLPEPAKEEDVEFLSDDEPTQQLATTVSEFQLPFPNRKALFQPPQRQENSEPSSPSSGQEAVELLGFVNVNGPQVALSINGFVATLAEKEEQDGVKVISIQPPTVSLMRGGRRMHRTLEN
jgi:hypothetical protein